MLPDFLDLTMLMLPAVQYNHNIFRPTGSGNVPGTSSRIVIIVETGEVGVPLSSWEQSDQASIGAKILPPGGTWDILTHWSLD